MLIVFNALHENLWRLYYNCFGLYDNYVSTFANLLILLYLVLMRSINDIKVHSITADRISAMNPVILSCL